MLEKIDEKLDFDTIETLSGGFQEEFINESQYLRIALALINDYGYVLVGEHGEEKSDYYYSGTEEEAEKKYDEIIKEWAEKEIPFAIQCVNAYMKNTEVKKFLFTDEEHNYHHILEIEENGTFTEGIGTRENPETLKYYIHNHDKVENALFEVFKNLGYLWIVKLFNEEGKQILFTPDQQEEWIYGEPA